MILSAPVRAVVLVAAMVAVVLMTPTQAAAAGKDMGTVEVIQGGGSTERSGGGGSSTVFSLGVPAPAECPGDSADDGYRVQSFIVPATDDPGALTYRSVMPVGEGRYALYDVYTNPYIQALTAKATRRGGPGPIVNVPDLNFAVFPPGKLPPGRYTIGIACSLMNETVRYWDTDIELRHAADDRPGQLRWRVLGTGASAGGDAPSPWAPFAGAALVAAGVVYVVRRRRVARLRPRVGAST